MERETRQRWIAAAALGCLLGVEALDGAAGSAPIAVSLRRPSEAIVLKSNGAVLSLDLERWSAPSMAFQVPADYQGTDIAAGIFKGAPTMCIVVNRTDRKAGDSYLLQIIGGRQVWTLLRPRGVYVGVAFDAERGLAYVSNSSTNQVLRIEVDKPAAPPSEVRRLLTATERIGAIALDADGQRLFTVDASGGLFAVNLQDRTVRTIDAPGLVDVRALAWDRSSRRLYAADSGSETLWRVAPDRDRDRTQPELVLRDNRYRHPSGIVIRDQGSVLMTDESADVLLDVRTANGQPGKIVRTAPLPSKPLAKAS